MTYSEFTRLLSDTNFNDFWKDSLTFNYLRLFWAKTLGSKQWFQEEQWQIDGLSGNERPEGDALLESYSLTAGSAEDWNQARFVFTNRFLSTARLLYDVRVLQGAIIPANDPLGAADQLRRFILDLTNSDLENEEWRDLARRHVPLEIWAEGQEKGDLKLFFVIEHSDQTVEDILCLLESAASKKFDPEFCHNLSEKYMKEKYGRSEVDFLLPEWLKELRHTFIGKFATRD
jgi:hypothetical protein